MKNSKSRIIRHLIIALMLVMSFSFTFQAKASAKGKVYSLLISEDNSVGARNDVSTMKKYVSSKKLFPTYTGTRKVCTYSCNYNGYVSDVKGSMKTAYSKVSSGDLAIFYFSGHSSYYGLKLSGTECYYWRNLTEDLYNIAGKGAKIAVILDTCYAARFYTNGYSYYGNNIRSKFIFIASSGASQRSIALTYKGKKMGMFTKWFSKGLTKTSSKKKAKYAADANKNGTVNISEILNYILAGYRKDKYYNIAPHGYLWTTEMSMAVYR